MLGQSLEREAANLLAPLYGRAIEAGNRDSAERIKASMLGLGFQPEPPYGERRIWIATLDRG